VSAEVLGHDNLNITAHYAQVSTRLMLRAYDAAHPHAKQIEYRRGEMTAEVYTRSPASTAASNSEMALVIAGATPKRSCHCKAIVTSLDRSSETAG